MVSDKLRQKRLDEGLSIEGLAEKSGVSRNMVGGIERVKENPSIKTLEKLARALGVEINYFFEDNN